MSDFGTLIETLVAESNMPGDEVAFRRHVVAALKHYRPYRFLFSEKSVPFTLIPQQDEYKPGGETIIVPGYTYLRFPTGTGQNSPGFVEFPGKSFELYNTPQLIATHFAIGLRFRTVDSGVFAQTLVMKQPTPNTGSTTYIAILLDPATDEVIFGINSGALLNELRYAPPTPWFDGEWHEFVCSFSAYLPSGIMQGFIHYDGVLTTSDAIPFIGSPESGEPFLWGAQSNDPEYPFPYPFRADLERLFVSDEALNLSVVNQMMGWEEGDDIPDSIIGFWPLTEGMGQKVLDRIPAPEIAGPGKLASSVDLPPHHGTVHPRVDWGDDSQVLDYDFPGDIMEFDEVRRQIGTRSSVPLEPVTIGELRELQASGLAYGQPDYWCWHHDRFIVWPRPSGAHVLTLDYHVDATRDEATGTEITPTSEVSVTNEFFRRGEELLRTRALYTYGLGRDDDFELAKRMKILNEEAEKSLMRERDIMKIDGHQAAFHL